jgi:beta-galactosidase
LSLATVLSLFTVSARVQAAAAGPLALGAKLYSVDLTDVSQFNTDATANCTLTAGKDGTDDVLKLKAVYAGSSYITALFKDKSAWSGKSEYIVQTTLKLILAGQSSTSAGIALGSDVKNFYHPRLDRNGSNQRVQEIQWINGGAIAADPSVSSDPAANRPTVSLPVAYDKYYTLSAVVYGSTIDIYVDGAYVLTSAKSSDIGNNFIGLRAYGCETYVKDLSVYETAAPTVAITAPSEGAALVSAVTVTGTTTGAATAEISVSGGAPAALTLDSNGAFTHTFTPDSAGAVSVTVTAFSASGAKTASDGRSFTYSPPAPGETYLTAALGQTTGVALAGAITVNFSAAVDAATAGGVTLLKGETLVPATVSANGAVVTITPDAPLQASSEYAVSIGPDVKSPLGDGVKNPPLLLGFTTEAPVSDPLPGSDGGKIITDLGGDWKFKTDAAALGANDWSEEDTASWSGITVPGSWNSYNDELNLYVGTAWYSRSFTVGADAEGYPAYLRLDRVYHDCIVYVNGNEAGTHDGGYTTFDLRVDQYLNYGGANTVAIAVSNAYGWGVDTIRKLDTANGAWFKWGGINGGAELIVGNAARFEWQHVTPAANIADSSGTVDIEYNVTNSSSSARTYSILSIITDKADGSETARASAALSVPAGSSARVSAARVDLASVKLWDTDRPNLYTVTTVLKDSAGNVMDTVSDNIGFRSFTLNKAAGEALLNGKVFRASGANRVWDDRAYGQTEPEFVTMRDIDYMKSMGMSFGRVSHVPMNKEILDYCDEVGFMLVCEGAVWGDQNPNAFPESGMSAIWKNWMTQNGLSRLIGVNMAAQWYTEMINRDYNHPSIIAWSIGNELRGNYTEVKNYGIYMRNLILTELDATRFITEPSQSAAGGSVNDSVATSSDFVSQNSYGGFSSNATNLWNKQKMPMFWSEYGGSVNSDSLQGSSPGYQSFLNDLSSVPQVFAASSWTLNDYRSNFNATSGSAYTYNTNENRSWGATTVWGDKKLAFDNMRKASTPVQSLTLTVSGDTAAKDTVASVAAALTIKPSSLIPSYYMEGYFLKLEIRDSAGDVTGGKLISLPAIERSNPGYTGAFAFAFNVPEGGVSLVRGSVVAPTGYEIYETFSYVSVPLAVPEIKEIVTSTTGARVVFTKAEGATSYTVSYGTTSFGSSGTATLYDFVAVSGLSPDTEYQFRVTARNAKGQTAASTVVKARTQGADSPETLPPPIILHTEPIASGFYVGYIYNDWPKNGTKFEIRYRAASSETWTTRTGITSGGAYRVDGLSPGVEYVYNFRVVTDTAESCWSETISVTPEGADQERAVPEILGGVPGADRVSLTFDPVAKSTGYVIKYGLDPAAPDQTVTLHRQQINQALITGLADGETYYFSMASLNGGTLSEYSEPVPITVGDVQVEAKPIASITTNKLTFAGIATRQIEGSLINTGADPITARVVFTGVPAGFAVSDTDVNASAFETKAFQAPVTVSPETTEGEYRLMAEIWSGGDILARKEIALVVVGEGVLLYEPFDDYEAGEWTVVSGTAPTLSDGQLSMSGTTLVITGETDWRDYTIEADMTYNLTASGAAGGIVFRYYKDGEGKDNYVHARLNMSAEQGVRIEIFEFVAGTAVDAAERLFILPGEVGLDLAVSGAVHFKVVNTADSAALYVNDVYCGTLEGIRSDGGKVGFRTYQTAIKVDNLIVYTDAAVIPALTATVSAELDGGTAAVTVTVRNTTGAPVPVYVIVGVYTADGRLAAIRTDTASVDAEQAFAFGFDVSKLPPGYKIKAFVWDPAAFSPLTPPMEPDAE